MPSNRRYETAMLAAVLPHQRAQTAQVVPDVVQRWLGCLGQGECVVPVAKSDMRCRPCCKPGGERSW